MIKQFLLLIFKNASNFKFKNQSQRSQINDIKSNNQNEFDNHNDKIKNFIVEKDYDENEKFVENFHNYQKIKKIIILKMITWIITIQIKKTKCSLISRRQWSWSNRRYFIVDDTNKFFRSTINYIVIFVTIAISIFQKNSNFLSTSKHIVSKISTIFHLQSKLSKKSIKLTNRLYSNFQQIVTNMFDRKFAIDQSKN